MPVATSLSTGSSWWRVLSTPVVAWKQASSRTSGYSQHPIVEPPDVSHENAPIGKTQKSLLGSLT